MFNNFWYIHMCKLKDLFSLFDMEGKIKINFIKKQKQLLLEYVITACNVISEPKPSLLIQKHCVMCGQIFS